LKSKIKSQFKIGRRHEYPQYLLCPITYSTRSKRCEERRKKERKKGKYLELLNQELQLGLQSLILSGLEKKGEEQDMRVTL